MNLLVTNTRNGQAYGVIRSLRPHATKIVATMYGPNRFVARLLHAANSRYVDKCYFVPSAVEDWRTGNIQRPQAWARGAPRIFSSPTPVIPCAQNIVVTMYGKSVLRAAKTAWQVKWGLKN